MRFIQGEFRVHDPYENFHLVNHRFHSIVNLDKLLPDIPLVRSMGG